MSCLRPPLLHTSRSNLLAASSRLRQLRYESSRPQIQVVSGSPPVRHPQEQQHKWSFLNSSQSRFDTTASENDTELLIRNAPVQGDPEIARMNAIRKAIKYTNFEKKLITLLRNAMAFINETQPSGKKVAMYFVGGWVRDKLLGKSPPDIDICIQNMKPSEFIQTFIDLNGFRHHSRRMAPLSPTVELARSQARQTNDKPIIVGSYKFEYDVRSGRAIEVAGITFFQTTVKLEFAEMAEDPNDDRGRSSSVVTNARERELTVNAIFLEVRNLALMDPTGTGIADLKRKVFRTPQKPKITLMDDPFRVMRLMRFASRFHEEGFTIDKDTYAAMNDPEIRLALTKFPPERIYKELGMLLKPRNNPAQVFRMIYETKYYRDFFSPPRPTTASEAWIPPVIPANNADYVVASWFLARLQREWDLWTPFEEALIDLPHQTNLPKDKKNMRALSALRLNVQSFAISIAAVLPWRKHTEKPADETGTKTIAGSILAAVGTRLLRPWELIDSMFEEDERTVRAVGLVLEVSSVEQAVVFKETYGQFWAAHVLCGAMFAWCDICEGQVGEKKLEEIWNNTEERWRAVAFAVDRIRWDAWGSENETESEEVQIETSQVQS